jgi:hypothetical protein
MKTRQRAMVHNALLPRQLSRQDDLKSEEKMLHYGSFVKALCNSFLFRAQPFHARQCIKWLVFLARKANAPIFAGGLFLWSHVIVCYPFLWLCDTR